MARKTFIARVIDDRENVDDLAQECFVRVFVHRRNYRRGSKFSTWVFTIAANLRQTNPPPGATPQLVLARMHSREVFSDSLPELADAVEGTEAGLAPGAAPGCDRTRHRDRAGRSTGSRWCSRDIEGLSYEESPRCSGSPGARSAHASIAPAACCSTNSNRLIDQQDAP
jgi:hypothetical protein